MAVWPEFECLLAATAWYDRRVSADAATFVTGPWTGFYTYRAEAERYRTDLIMEFVRGRITGEGKDSVGPFVICGGYDSGTGECYWTKSYVAAHDVFYRGFRDGKGIWGMWEIEDDARGGFRIWPLAEGEGVAYVQEAEEPVESKSAIVIEV